MKAIYTLLIILIISTFYSCNDEEDITMNENLVYTIFGYQTETEDLLM